MIKIGKTHKIVNQPEHDTRLNLALCPYYNEGHHFPGPCCTDSNSATGNIVSFRHTLLPCHIIKSEGSWFHTRLQTPAAFHCWLASVLGAHICPFICKTEILPFSHPLETLDTHFHAGIFWVTCLSSTIFDIEHSSTDHFSLQNQ